MSIPTINNSSSAADSRTVRTSSGQTSATGTHAGAKASAAGQQPASRARTDEVSISTQAGDLQALENSIRQLPEVDSARVSALREQINAGQYTVDSSRLADKILAFETKL
jgi:negative regulator of flagellin synthesis FlgM